MEKLIRVSRFAYCIGLAGMVVPQFIYMEFGNNMFPKWPGLPWLPLWAYLFSIVVLAACVAIVLEKKGRIVSLLLGSLLLLIYLSDIPYELIIDPYNKHLGSWTDLMKTLALAGGAFSIAGSFPKDPAAPKSSFIDFLEKLIPFGPALFCTTMFLYGFAHFLYPQFISTLVPNWIPGHYFWTYFAGVALMAAAIGITFKIQLKLAALTLGTTIFVWLIILHIPLAIADPLGGKANSIISAFSAVAFAGICFVIAGNATIQAPVPESSETPKKGLEIV